ncbi:putative FAD-dependent thymidylate synthase [Vibrio phage 277E43-1]|nr:putative FAD-dependent thymidylate synthase [Vibrio phage 277E43-1]
MYKVEKFGKGGISAKIVGDSVNYNGNRVTTYELEYHRYIHGEVMTHRLFSRNAMSSRAVPVDKMIEQSNTIPIHFGKNQAGMQADYEHEDIETGKEFWEEAKHNAIETAANLTALGFHKQVVNRLLEPFQMMKIVLTATEFENFFWLRCDKDAQPEIQELARLMFECREESKPELLEAGEWHTPYVQYVTHGSGLKGYFDNEGNSLTIEEAIAISSSCCAQVSYRSIDNSYDKAMKVYERLGVGDNKIHASPFEHVACPMVYTNSFDHTRAYINKPTKELTQKDTEWEKGVTHCDRNMNLWSGNFKGWIQHRQLLDNHTKW